MRGLTVIAVLLLTVLQTSAAIINSFYSGAAFYVYKGEAVAYPPNWVHGIPDTEDPLVGGVWYSVSSGNGGMLDTNTLMTVFNENILPAGTTSGSVLLPYETMKPSQAVKIIYNQNANNRWSVTTIWISPPNGGLTAETGDHSTLNGVGHVASDFTDPLFVPTMPVVRGAVITFRSPDLLPSSPVIGGINITSLSLKCDSASGVPSLTWQSLQPSFNVTLDTGTLAEGVYTYTLYAATEAYTTPIGLGSISVKVGAATSTSHKVVISVIAKPAANYQSWFAPSAPTQIGVTVP